MPELKYTWTGEQIAGVNERAVLIFLDVIDGKNLPPVILPNVYQGILHMAGSIETTSLVPGVQLPRMDIPGGR